jgi:hypothetical protein
MPRIGRPHLVGERTQGNGEQWLRETEPYRDRIGKLYDALDLLTPAFEQLPPSPLNYRPSTIGGLKYQLCILTIGMSRSAQELLSSASVLSVTGKFLAASVCIRLLIELWGVLAFAERKVLRKLDEPADAATANDLLVKLLRGSKSGVPSFRGDTDKVAVINVMEFVRAADAISPGTLQTYDFLCDAAHPTYTQHGYLLFSGSDYDNWSNVVFAQHAHTTLNETVAAAELAILGLSQAGNRIFTACLPQILDEAKHRSDAV